MRSRKPNGNLENLEHGGSGVLVGIIHTPFPESDPWQDLCEARRRGDATASQFALQAIERLLEIRESGAPLGTVDYYPGEHRLATDALLGDAWKTYKRALRDNDLATARAAFAFIQS